MKKRKLHRKPKKLSYILVDHSTDLGRDVYAILERLVEAHHSELREARIALAWCLSWQPDVDGRCVLGKCKKASDLDREIAPYDFVVLLRREFFDDPMVTDQQRRALIDHELSHAAVAYDRDGEPVVDQRGRTVFRIRKHDLEEFSDIAERYGCWKKDLEAFGAALDKARQRSRNWVGYQTLREKLVAIGITVPLDTVISWSDEQRKDAEIWVGIQRELKAQRIEHAIEVTPPEHLARAIEASQAGDLFVGSQATA